MKCLAWLRHISPGRSCRRIGPYWLFQLPLGTAAAAHELSGVCVYLAGGSRLKHCEDQLPKSFNVSNLKLHYLFRQDFLAANLTSFFASSAVKRKDADTRDGAQGMACVLWQHPGSAELGGAVRQEPTSGRATGASGPAACCLL